VRSQAEAIVAADSFEAVTLTGARMYVLAVIEHATHRVRILGATAPGRHRAPDCRLGHPGRAQPRDGPARRRLPGALAHPRPGRQRPGTAPSPGWPATRGTSRPTPAPPTRPRSPCRR
jgi:hypothetical protein